MLRRVVLSRASAAVRVAPASRSISQSIHLCKDEKNDETTGEQAETLSEEQQEQEPAAEAEAQNPLQKQVEELTAANEDLNARLLRALAETENVRRISKQDVQNAREFAISKFAKSLLDVSDNLERAHTSVSLEDITAEQAQESIKTLHEGVVMTDGQLRKVFNEFNISSVGQVGDKFDPNVHEAMFEYEDPNLEPGSIGQMLKTGYTLNSRVLRPAQVGVVKASK